MDDLLQNNDKIKTKKSSLYRDDFDSNTMAGEDMFEQSSLLLGKFIPYD